jgi:hypothetical protein
VDNVSDMISKDQQTAAEQGKSTTALAEKLLPESDILSAIAEQSAREISGGLGKVNEHPSDGRPRGRLDIVLAQLFDMKTDKKGHSYRPFDDLEDDGDKQFVAQLVDKRYTQKNRNVTTREVQRVVDICAKVNIHWKTAHNHKLATLEDGTRPNG